MEIPKLILQIIGSSALAALYAVALAWLGLSPRMEREGWMFFAGWIAIVSLVALSVGGVLMWVHVRQIGTVVGRIRRGLECSAGDVERALHKALNLPLDLGLTGFFLWLVPLVSLPISAALVKGAPDMLSVFIAFVATLGIGVVHCTFLVYIVERAAKRGLIPTLVSTGQVLELRGLRPVPVRWKLVLLFVTTALFPIFSFTVMHAGGAASTAAALFLGLSSVVLGVTQSAIISSSISRPLGVLQDEMTRVSEGDLSVRLQVLSADELGQLSQNFNLMVSGLERAEFVKETFGSYVSRPVLDEILRGNVKLGGQRMEATILFSDIRGFTSLSESLPPEEVVRFLNRYLDEMVDALVAHGATIDKFVGDAILATFGVPVPQEDHALRAVRGALAMLERLRTLNDGRVAAGQAPVRIGIGIHTGQVVAGNIGSEKKMEYTVIGDTVNTASRVESLNKRFDTTLLVSAETQTLISGSIEARCLGPAEVKGKSAPVVVYEVLSPGD